MNTVFKKDIDVKDLKALFKKGVTLETKSLKALNEAYYESDDSLKKIKSNVAKSTVRLALGSIYDDYFIYQVCYKKECATNYSYFFENIIDTLNAYLDYCDLVLT